MGFLGKVKAAFGPFFDQESEKAADVFEHLLLPEKKKVFKNRKRCYNKGTLSKNVLICLNSSQNEWKSFPKPALNSRCPSYTTHTVSMSPFGFTVSKKSASFQSLDLMIMFMSLWLEQKPPAGEHWTLRVLTATSSLSQRFECRYELITYNKGVVYRCISPWMWVH